MNREIRFRAWNKKKVPIRKGSKGWYRENGYIMQKTIGHPNANKRGYMAEHRLVYENDMGRYLKPKEVIHHKNHIRHDNRLCNLQLSYSHSEHIKNEHQPKRNPNGTRITEAPIFSEIKHRLYDKDNDVIGIFTLNKLISTTFRRGKFEFRGRFTGLKDKNGKEIYESDVVIHLKENYQVKFGKIEVNPDSMGNTTTIVGYYLHNISNGYNHDIYGELEVIGNIHENPELLDT